MPGDRDTGVILGIDEVGRGAWAGPLVVGAVVLGGVEIDGLTDSKLLTKKRREVLYDEIYEKAAAVGLGWGSADEIDNIGLGPALRLATRRAVEQAQQTKTAFSEIIIDGTVNFLGNTALETYVTTMKKADLLVPSVSAASIVAKVARDRYMAEQDTMYSDYKFAAHVGYGTAVHRAAIAAHGVTPLHRLSIAPLAQYRAQPAETSLERLKQPRIRRIFSKFTSSQSAELGGSPKQSSAGEEENSQKIGSTRNAPSASNKVSTTRAIGDASETVAAEELVHRGHEIIARNWKTKYCEIDIVSKKDDAYYFTEVKHRKNANSGDGLAAITPKKLNQMRYAAKFYAHTQKLVDVQLQLCAVTTTGDNPMYENLIVIAE